MKRKGHYVIRIHSVAPILPIEGGWGVREDYFPQMLSTPGKECLEAYHIDADLVEVKLKLSIVKKCLHVGIAFVPTEDIPDPAQ